MMEFIPRRINRILTHPRHRGCIQGLSGGMRSVHQSRILCENIRSAIDSLDHHDSITVNDKDSLKPTIKIPCNPCNIQMISDELHSQLFPNVSRQNNFDKKLVDKCKKHLESHNLWGKRVKRTAPVRMSLPALEGDNIDSHFRHIAQEQTLVYKMFLEELIKKGIPSKPDQWVFQEGWTKYTPNESPVPVPFPEGNCFVFDIEVCQATGQVPTLATAVSTEAWYSWCSSLLITGSDRNPHEPMTIDDLIPFETCRNENTAGKTWVPKVIIGHNVSYDRARVKEQYFLEETKTRFLDTMSMHIAISGITSYQRALKMTMKSRMKAQSSPSAIGNASEEESTEDLDWNETSSLNNLSDVYQLYCPGPELKKEARNVFVTGSIPDVVAEFQNLMSYCARDVEATYKVFEKILPIYFQRFPHPVTFAGTLEMGTSYLPINSNWNRYIQQSEESYRNLEKEVKHVLMKKADDALKLLEGEKYKNDPWLWDLDWKVSKVRTKKPPKETKKGAKKQKDASSTTTTVATEADPPKAFPAWYKKLFYRPSEENYQPGPSKISTSTRVVPKLLRLCWFGFPLYYADKGGWGFLVKKMKPTSQNVDNSDPFLIFLNSGQDDVFFTNNGRHENKNFAKLDDNIEEDLTTSSDSPKSEEEVSQFPYKQWEEIWEKNKSRLIKQYPSICGSATNVKIIGDQVQNNKEDAAQEMKDFMKGLEALTTLGLRASTATKDRKVADVTSPHPKCEFRPLPHKDGANYRVGNPLAKDFLNKIEDNILTCATGEDVATKVVTFTKMLSYWRNNRDRIMGQIAVWVNGPKNSDNEQSGTGHDNFEFGAILPQVAVSGTLTRRAVEPTWMTASNAYVDRIGSELKGMIQAPPDYYFVGADVDSQELWIASVIGDAQFAGIHGSTALGWMTLQGNKSVGTDMHSKTAALIGIDRDQAKVLNYGRIYGAGVNFTERLLMQFNHHLTSTDARTKARALYQTTKGEKKYLLNQEGRNLAQTMERFSNKFDEPLSRKEMQHFIRQLQCSQRDMMEYVDKIVWDGGTESHMFNRVEAIAQQDCPSTPILNCSISRSLVPSAVQNDFMMSRVNWVVQSSAVDYLHLMLTCMRWLFQKYDVKGRFSISVHDEVRFLVKSEDRYRAALALQITNIFTRAMCSYQLGMFDLPQSVAFFSCVDIDKVLRKEVTQDCKTPSNPEGLWKGYGIPRGEALDIYDLLKKTGDMSPNAEQV